MAELVVNLLIGLCCLIACTCLRILIGLMFIMLERLLHPSVGIEGA